MIPKIHPNIKKQIYVQIGQQLKAARLAQGLSIEQYCKSCNYSAEGLQKLESGDAFYISNRQIGDLANLFACYGKVLHVSFANMPEADRISALSGYSNEELQSMIDSRQ